MEEGKTDLLKFLVNYAIQGHIWQVLVALVIVNIPAIAAYISEWRSGKKIEQLYESRLKDKDAEIKRLAARVKDLENLLLKTKRP